MDISDSDFENTPPEITAKAENVTLELLPEISRKKYEMAYAKFMDWRRVSKVNSFSENVLLVYFEHLSTTLKASTIWSQYSMLRSTLSIKDNVDISTYSKLRSLLKRKSENYVPKKSKILSAEEIQKFINDAPDEKYLLTKVALVFGLTGACRRDELCKLMVDDLEDLRSALLVTIKHTKNKTPRSFTITGEFYKLYQKYAALRPKNISQQRFFVNFQNGKCTKQPVGLNKFGGMAREVATFLKLPNANLYTGHCFRRSSATILVNAGGDLLTLKRHGGWRSSTVAEGYIDDSLQNKIDISKKITNSIQANENATTNNIIDSNTITYINAGAEPSTSSTLNETPGIILKNCSNITINYYNN